MIMGVDQICERPAWLEALYREKYFVGCSYHETAKKNEKNVCCLDCCISICPHCIPSHRFHRLLQVRRYVYHEVVRLDDLQKLIDCSNVQAYTINSAKVVFIKKRPQNRQFKGAGNYCTSCDRSLQETYSHCSLGCKVDFVLKHYKELTPFLKRCNTLTLSPDFMIPHEIGDDIDQMTNETPSPHSSIVDCDESDHQAMRWSSSSSSAGSSSGSENMTTTTHIVRKKEVDVNSTFVQDQLTKFPIVTIIITSTWLQVSSLLEEKGFLIDPSLLAYNKSIH